MAGTLGGRPRPQSTSKAGVDELGPKFPEAYRKANSISAQQNLGPNLVSRPEDYTPPQGMRKGGIVRRGKTIKKKGK